MKKTAIAMITLSLFLVACKGQQAVKPTPRPTATAGGYQDFQSSVIGNGEKSVLFFHASWCPMCQDKDKKLTELYESSKVPVKTYKVDFDTSTDLKQQYGITMQDTFVLIDGSGEVVKKEAAPSFSGVKRLLYLNIDPAKAMEEKPKSMMEGMERMNDRADMEVDAPTEVPSLPKIGRTGAQGTYTAFSSDVIGNGEESVLFFHAAWCPKCKANDGLLTTYYGAEAFPRSTYKIDFDSATELRAHYGVTGQDTFILIDGSGNEISRTRFPSPSALKDLLG